MIALIRKVLFNYRFNGFDIHGSVQQQFFTFDIKCLVHCCQFKTGRQHIALICGIENRIGVQISKIRHIYNGFNFQYRFVKLNCRQKSFRHTIIITPAFTKYLPALLFDKLKRNIWQRFVNSILLQHDLHLEWLLHCFANFKNSFGVECLQIHIIQFTYFFQLWWQVFNLLLFKPGKWNTTFRNRQ